ncbi:hexameric tyrosine-coordinated heme protein [Planococcus halocryophilus]|uniref:hexameric tyrosine-coordinated heme protein n=1 Tax=Planococcus halocryophilus TaxID=1215089 RepID=UPI001F0D1A32|nr:hexameric tyrosine-coordinated heme protein [Planococcus halocryophilus]MCH4825223.1 hexameric tyrosine-coordinated heme protein [Planococcus halocryophilus]
MSQQSWLPTLKTNTAEEGYELAVKLARKAVGMTQPDENIRKKLRLDYANNADSLTLASQVVAIHFQTVAAANNYWNDK